MLEYILSCAPTGCERYVEPFGGGGTVLLSMYPHKFEAYNDYNSDLVNMFRCIRDKALSFFKAANLLPLNSRQEFGILKDFLDRKEPDFSYIEPEMRVAEEYFTNEDLIQIQKILTTKAELYDVERAVTFYKLIRYSYAGTGKSFGGQPINIARVLEHIYSISNRLKNVVIENKDFGDFIPLHDKPSTFMYLDPPYYMTEGFYNGFSRDDHLRLFDSVSSMTNTKFLLSYNSCEYIKKLYSDYTIVDVKRPHSMAHRFSSGSEFHEVLIANYDINERKKSRPVQICFYDTDREYARDYLYDYRNKRPNSRIFYMANALNDLK